MKMEEAITQADLEQRKVSVISLRKFSQKSTRSDEDDIVLDPPMERYHILHLLFFILGIGTLVPMSFFLSANNYWMWKFRDLNEGYDPTIRNTLQKNFQSTSAVISSISSIITNIVSSIFAQKLTLRLRLVGSMCISVPIFIVYTGFVVIDTDSWQLVFFILTMIVYFLNNIAVSLFMLTSMAMMSRFPPLYLKTLMYGISLGTLMGSMVQIICLAFGGSSTEVALIYFTIGTIICVITLIVSYCIQYNPRFNFYQGDVEADTKKPLPTWRELKEVSVNIWPHLLSTFIGCITSTMSGPSITALITSDNYKAEDPWTAVYFVPVLAFFLPGVCGLLSRIASTPIVNICWKRCRTDISSNGNYDGSFCQRCITSFLALGQHSVRGIQCRNHMSIFPDGALIC